MSDERKVKLCGVSLLAAIAFVLPVAAQQPEKPSRAVRSLFEGGVRKCLYQLDILVKTAHKDDDQYALVTTLGQPVDQAGYTLITVETIGKTAATRTFAVTPDESQGCSISTTFVIPVSSNCAVTRDEVFDEWKFFGQLGIAAAYERESEEAATVVLVPTESAGCLLIKSTNESFLGDEQLRERATERERKRS